MKRRVHAMIRVTTMLIHGSLAMIFPFNFASWTLLLEDLPSGERFVAQLNVRMSNTSTILVEGGLRSILGIDGRFIFCKLWSK
jgi:hypothetical protein